MSRGADVRARNRRGAEPLHYAADGAPGSDRWDPDAQYAVIEFLKTLQVLPPGVKDLLVDEHYQKRAWPIAR